MFPKEELESNYVSVPEAGEMLNLGRNRIGKLCRAGRFDGAAKIGNHWIIPRESVLNHKPLPPGVRPGTQTKKAKLAAEKAAFLEQAEAPME